MELIIGWYEWLWDSLAPLYACTCLWLWSWSINRLEVLGPLLPFCWICGFCIFFVQNLRLCLFVLFHYSGLTILVIFRLVILLDDKWIWICICHMPWWFYRSYMVHQNLWFCRFTEVILLDYDFLGDISGYKIVAVLHVYSMHGMRRFVAFSMNKCWYMFCHWLFIACEVGILLYILKLLDNLFPLKVLQFSYSTKSCGFV